jgi:prepilin-type N-terminal cleavage/methylation domain-containing protein
MRRSTSGFTIVELLIVIVVIAILAAVSVVAYTGIQNRANDSAIQSDLRNLSMKVNEYYALHGEYPAGGGNPQPAFFSGIRFAPSKNAYYKGVNNLYYCGIPSGSNAGYGVAARSASGKIFAIVNGSFFTYPNTTWSTNTVICGNLGINTSDPLYNFAWGQTTANAWNGWID